MEDRRYKIIDNKLKELSKSKFRSSFHLRKYMISYIDEKGYAEDEAPEQIVMDYIAGMTDAYALQTFEDLYWI